MQTVAHLGLIMIDGRITYAGEMRREQLVQRADWGADNGTGRHGIPLQSMDRDRKPELAHVGVNVLIAHREPL
jgi:hypothetical protein